MLHNGFCFGNFKHNLQDASFDDNKMLESFIDHWFNAKIKDVPINYTYMFKDHKIQFYIETTSMSFSKDIHFDIYLSYIDQDDVDMESYNKFLNYMYDNYDDFDKFVTYIKEEVLPKYIEEFNNENAIQIPMINGSFNNMIFYKDHLYAIADTNENANHELKTFKLTGVLNINFDTNK